MIWSIAAKHPPVAPVADAAAQPASGVEAPAGGEVQDQNIYIGRQPIVDREQQLVAFELLFHAEASGAEAAAGNFEATANVVVNAFTEFGVQNTLGPHRGFLNVGRDLLMSDLPAVLPPARIVLELIDTVLPDEAVIQRCKALRSAGYRLALDHVCAFDDRVKKLLPYVHMVKLDIAEIEEATLVKLVPALRHLPLLLIADKVDTAERAQHCLQLGFDLFQGYHFARPEIVSGKRAQPAKLALLRLSHLLLSDAEVDDIENELKQHPDLAYNLMRIVNSVAFGLSRKIDSIGQCIAVLGRAKLTRWVQLLLYSASRNGNDAANPLMQMAATRGKWMETLAHAQRPGDKSYQDLAFMVGILSLLDALLAMPIREVVDGLNLADEVKAALLTREGPLGTLLQLIEHKESNAFEAVSRDLQAMPFLTPASFTSAELDAATWANSIAAAA